MTNPQGETSATAETTSPLLVAIDYAIQHGWPSDSLAKIARIREADRSRATPTPAAGTKPVAWMDDFGSMILDVRREKLLRSHARRTGANSYNRPLYADLATPSPEVLEPAGAASAEPLSASKVIDAFVTALRELEWSNDTKLQSQRARDVLWDNHYMPAKERPVSIPDGDEWKSIETAPKDGTNILGFSQGFHRIAVWWFFNNRWSCDASYHTAPLMPPTHWQPLPAAPLPTTQEAEPAPEVKHG